MDFSFVSQALPFDASALPFDLSALLIICPLVFLAGFVDAIAGGGGLISLPAYLLAGIPPVTAVGTNKLASAIGTATATFRLWRGGYVSFRKAAPAGIAAIAGSLIGARLALIAPEEVFRMLLIVALPIAAAFVMRKRTLRDETDHTMSHGRRMAIVVTFAFLLGGYDGFYGPGTGTFMLIAFTAVARMSVKEASGEMKRMAIVVTFAFLLGGYDGFYGPGTGTFMLIAFTAVARMSVKEASGEMKVANLASNIAALAMFASNGATLIALGLIAAVFQTLGSYLGAGRVMKDGTRIVRPIIVAVLILLFAKVILEQTGVLG